jgi:hypothetical protein
MGDIPTTGLQRFGKLLCAQLDLFLQVGGRFLQPAGHVVGLSGERLDLVSSLDGNALAEVAAAEARRTGAQRLDRLHHAPGEEHALREGERAEKDEPGALDLNRRLDEYQPAERSPVDGGGPADYPIA